MKSSLEMVLKVLCGSVDDESVEIIRPQLLDSTSESSTFFDALETIAKAPLAIDWTVFAEEVGPSTSRGSGSSFGDQSTNLTRTANTSATGSGRIPVRQEAASPSNTTLEQILRMFGGSIDDQTLSDISQQLRIPESDASHFFAQVGAIAKNPLALDWTVFGEDLEDLDGDTSVAQTGLLSGSGEEPPSDPMPDLGDDIPTFEKLQDILKEMGSDRAGSHLDTDGGKGHDPVQPPVELGTKIEPPDRLLVLEAKEFQDLTDGELVSLIAGDDPHIAAERAFEELYERYLPVARRIILWYGTSRNDEQDLFQEAFIRLLRSIRSEKFHPEGNLRKYFHRVVQRVVIDHQRRERFKSHREPGNPAPELASSLDSGYASLMHKEESAILEEALARLTPSDRQLISLRYLESMAYSEIAATLGTSTPSACVKVHRAIKRLRSILQAE